MNHILDFAIGVIVISASGVMAPGPLFAANVVYGTRESTRAGLKMAIGHTMVELPLVVLLGVGTVSLETFPEFRDWISILGALTLFVFAGIHIKSTFQKKELTVLHQKHGAVIAGVMLSALNPFFIIWWLSIGFKMISDAVAIWAFAGIFILFLLHIWMDFAWLGTVAFLTRKSLKILSNKGYKIMMLGLGASMVYFGISFIADVF